MKITNKNLALGAVLLALVLFVSANVWLEHEAVITSSDSIELTKVRLQYLTFKLDVYKTIGIGFLIALLGLLIPNILPEAKYQFDKIKEGRKVFSEAKTGIDYLRFRLPDMDRLSAIGHINQIHQLKHLTDAYIKDDTRIARWPYAEPYDAYHILMAYLDVVSDTTIDWDKISPHERRKKLLELHQRIEAGQKK